MEVGKPWYFELFNYYSDTGIVRAGTPRQLAKTV